MPQAEFTHGSYYAHDVFDIDNVPRGYRSASGVGAWAYARDAKAGYPVKWQAEFQWTKSAELNAMYGLVNPALTTTNPWVSTNNDAATLYMADGKIYHNNTQTAASSVPNDSNTTAIIGVCHNTSTKNTWWIVNGAYILGGDPVAETSPNKTMNGAYSYVPQLGHFRYNDGQCVIAGLPGQMKYPIAGYTPYAVGWNLVTFSPGTRSKVLSDINGNPLISRTDLHVRFYDGVGTATQLIHETATGTTDAAGVLTTTYYTSLADDGAATIWVRDPVTGRQKAAVGTVEYV